MTERWRPVEGYEGLYEISDMGRVISHHRSSGAYLMKPHINKWGNAIVFLAKRGVSRSQQVHRLVALTFMGNPGDGFEVCHNNGIPDDNRVENLRWDTHRNNMLDQVRHGTHGNARKTHCKYGHELVGENIRVSGNKRICRPCNMRTSREWRERNA